MPMKKHLSSKKYLTSLVFIVLFAGYVALQYLLNDRPIVNITGNATPSQQIANSNDNLPRSASPSNQTPAQTETVPIVPSAAPTQISPQPVPRAVPTPKPKGQYADGKYAGDIEDAYYGFVQIQTTVSGGRLVDVRFLQYPNDRSTSRFISQQAMPILIQEAIQAQSASVDGVSGASDTSAAFQQSLASALAQAKSRS